MSIKRVKTVKRAQKDQGTCSKCGDALPAGSPYRYWKPMFRSRFKMRRCMKPTCSPRMSELESSAISEIYAAMENAEDVASQFETGEGVEETQELTDAITEVQEAIDAVAGGYREADEAFGGSGATQHAERADELESIQLDANFEEFEGNEEDEEEVRDWRAAQAQILRDALEEVQV